MDQLPTDSAAISTTEFIANCSDMMIPIAGSIAYFSVVPLDEEESQRLIFDPATAIPPRVTDYIPDLRLVIVPYLEPDAGQDGREWRIAFKKPAGATQCAVFKAHGGANYLFIAVHDEEVFDAHVVLYRALAERILAEAGESLSGPFNALVDKELRARAHGEVYEFSWQLKRELRRHGMGSEERAAALTNYRYQALEDTLTLYLHGLCCDLEIDAGPKQLATRFVRKRLLYLKDQLPPPSGVPLFPEDILSMI